MQRINIFEENKRLRKELEQERKLRKEWQTKYYALEKELKEIKALLAQFLNSNTPSSKLPPTFTPKSFSPDRQPKGTNPRGKPKDSPGATRETPEKIDEHIQAKTNRCPNGHRKIRKKGNHTRIIYELDKIVLKTKEFTILEYECKKCGICFEATHPELPKQGSFGPQLQSFITELHHNFAGSYNRINTFIQELTNKTFTPQTIMNSIQRVAQELKPSYKEMEKKLPEAPLIQSDETSWPVNGQNYWLWLLCTANLVFITINKSRARKVITNILGEYYPGVIGSDCFKAYRNFAAAFQRCWAHLLRKTHFERDKKPETDVSKLHEQLTLLYNNIKAFLETNPSFEQRVYTSIMYHQKLDMITDHLWESTAAKSITANLLKEHQGQWLVPILIPEAELTNNKDERGIRKVIPTRKLLGGHRTEQGSENFAIIETHRQTWRLQNQSPYTQLTTTLMERNATIVA